MIGLRALHREPGEDLKAIRYHAEYSTMFTYALGGSAELRLLEPHQAEEFYALVDANRARLRAFLPWVDGTRGPEDVRAFIGKALEQYAGRLGFHAGIWTGGRAAGCIGMHPIDWNNRGVSLGYWIGEEHQGKGLVTAACRAVIRECFETYGLHRVEIRCSSMNTRSCAIPGRLGFHREGTMRHAQKLASGWTDIEVFSLLNRAES